MRTGIALDYSGGFHEAVDRIVELEKAGVNIAVVAEAYSFDAVSQLGYLAAKTNTVELASGVFPIYIRTPVAAGDDRRGAGLRVRRSLPAGDRHVGTAGDRGIPRRGVRRPVGPHPRGRRDLPARCGAANGCNTPGKHYQVPLPPDRGTGLGKPLQLINHPVRERIPITIAALGPKNVELTAEIAEGWQPVFFHPEKADSVWGEALAAGTARNGIPRWDRWTSWCTRRWPSATTSRNGWPGSSRSWPSTSAAWAPRAATSITTWPPATGTARSPTESRSSICLAASGKPSTAVPDELVRAMSLVGPRGFIAERIAAFAEAGVTTLLVSPAATDPREAVRFVEEALELRPA